MQTIDMNLNIFKEDVIKECFNAFKTVVDGEINIEGERAIVSFYTEDINSIKEFANYVIGESAVRY